MAAITREAEGLGGGERFNRKKGGEVEHVAES
jgi:hypothetical protein